MTKKKYIAGMDPAAPTTGPGLFEFIDDTNAVPYNPGIRMVDYKLTDEEHAMFDSMDDTPENIDMAKKGYSKLKGPKSEFEILREKMAEIWSDRTNWFGYV
jgi:hypothetical protein